LICRRMSSIIKNLRTRKESSSEYAWGFARFDRLGAIG
jgi:hypothetical protein